MADTTNAPVLNVTESYVTPDAGVTKTTLLDVKNGTDTATGGVITLNKTVGTLSTDVSNLDKSVTALSSKVDNLSNTNPSDPSDTSSYILKSQISAAGGVVGIASNNHAYLPITNGITGYLRGGIDADGNVVSTYTSTYFQGELPQVGLPFQLGFVSKKGTDRTMQLWGTCLSPSDPNLLDIGTTSCPIKSTFLSVAPTITSDIRVKSIITNNIEDTHPKLLDAVYSLSANLYKLKDAISDKGEATARIHAGFIAQEVEAALKEQGLNPSDYSFWSEEPLTESIKETVKDADGNELIITNHIPKLDENGKQIIQQSLRYEELFVLLIEANHVKTNERLAALEAKLNG